MKLNDNNSKAPYILTINKINTTYKKQNINKNNNNKKKEFIFKQEFSPLSGSEPIYEPQKWNKNYKVKNSHNCYSYSLGKIVPGIKSKAQPGYGSGFEHINDNEYKCSAFFKRLKKDSPATYIEQFDNKCMPGFYKIFLALDKENDYHWYRQDNNKYWSHKPGYSEVVNIDAKDEKIKNPVLSNRDFKHRNYYKPCFFACVYSDLTRSIDEIYSHKI